MADHARDDRLGDAATVLRDVVEVEAGAAVADVGGDAPVVDFGEERQRGPGRVPDRVQERLACGGHERGRAVVERRVAHGHDFDLDPVSILDFGRDRPQCSGYRRRLRIRVRLSEQASAQVAFLSPGQRSHLGGVVGAALNQRERLEYGIVDGTCHLRTLVEAGGSRSFLRRDPRDVQPPRAEDDGHGERATERGDDDLVDVHGEPRADEEEHQGARARQRSTRRRTRPAQPPDPAQAGRRDQYRPEHVVVRERQAELIGPENEAQSDQARAQCVPPVRDGVEPARLAERLRERKQRIGGRADAGERRCCDGRRAQRPHRPRCQREAGDRAREQGAGRRRGRDEDDARGDADEREPPSPAELERLRAVEPEHDGGERHGHCDYAAHGRYATRSDPPDRSMVPSPTAALTWMVGMRLLPRRGRTRRTTRLSKP